MTAWLYRLRGELVALWCLATGWLAWPARGGWSTLAPLILGLSLRAWARRYAGAHTRGRRMAAPYRTTGGPYRWLDHPLYLANLLVLGGLAWRLVGDRPFLVLASLCGPLALYALLARAERQLLNRTLAPATNLPVDARSGKWTSEWASILPPLAVWVLVGW